MKITKLGERVGSTQSGKGIFLPISCKRQRSGHFHHNTMIRFAQECNFEICYTKQDLDEAIAFHSQAAKRIAEENFGSLGEIGALHEAAVELYRAARNGLPLAQSCPDSHYC